LKRFFKALKQVLSNHYPEVKELTNMVFRLRVNA
jgi:hypothetical protein